jgi:EAL domain-containing protein (putative c-di-GMP-specific phosphodiesterase class I)
MKAAMEMSPQVRSAARARVLFVDDEPQMTTALRRVLSSEPFDVAAANTVADAFTLMAEQEFDIVVSDELMPDMNGSEFLRQVRTEHPYTVRILLTGKASLDTAIQAVNRAGIFRFLQKPCSAQDLIESLRDAVTHRHERVLAPPTLLPPPDNLSIELSARYERALQGLWMAVQPVVSMPGRCVYAYECLVRSSEPSIPHGGAFVELAERLHRSVDLDRQIRRHVAAMLQQAPEALTVLVNLHPSSLDDADLFDPEAPLSRCAERVVLEITERASLHDLNGAREKVTALRALGYRIAVDDLGAGYAGLTSLVLLHPEIVKIDMELVRGIHNSPTKSKLVSAVITLCRELGAQVIAEGIESIEECRALEALGCGLLQGYFFARPGAPYPNVHWPRT